MTMPVIDTALLREVEQFLFHEAHLQDSHDYDGWEALWTDDAVYWIPANGDDTDPTKQMSIVYDNRSRIAARTRQFHTGKRLTQSPVSRIAHLITNIALADEAVAADGDVSVRSNAMIFESNLSGHTVWACRNEYRLRRIDGALRIAFKKVMLVNNDKALRTLSFLV